MFGPISHITLIRQILKLLNNLRNILLTDISNGVPCLFVSLWTSKILEAHRGDQPLSQYSQILFWLWRFGFHLVQTNKIQRYVPGNVLPTILDLRVFPNIVTTAFFHVHRCDIFLSERLPSGSTMINILWC